jgi:uncharacterized radical SAM superfamily protein
MKPEMWQRRQALQIAAMLPDDPNDALQVLSYARELVEKFLQGGAAPSGEDHKVLDFRDVKSSSLEAKSTVSPSNRPR